MKIWLSKNSEIPVREQLITQITLGIISGDLPVGEKLSSTRELARRFKLHANTVSSAYQKLTEQGLIRFKKGSGFYVCETKQKKSDDETELDALIANFFQTAQSQGYSKNEIQNRLQKWFTDKPPEQFLVIESDRNLREILIEEISQTTNFRVVGTSFENFAKKQHNNTVFTAMINEKQEIESVLPADKICFFIKPRSVSDSMTDENRPEQNDLIAVVSGWEKFLSWSKTILIAANVESDSIVLRSTAEKDWKKGLKNASLIICDALAAKEFPNDKRIRVFRLIADVSLSELKNISANKTVP
ncbi:MAG: GntR family transcriptional regulator [Acidobacteria bacterium]|jgi:GntR family transcriptional regulator|nr:GntR family transcriptional regulator [Acidobacteriota bacterium]